MKLCPACNHVKPLADFHKSKASKDGCGSFCKPCACVKTRIWADANPLKAKAAQRAHYLRKKELTKERAKRWAAENKERRIEIRRASQLRRKEAMKERRKQQRLAAYWGNIQRSRLNGIRAARLYKERHPEIYRIRQRSAKHRRRALALGVETSPVSFTGIVKRDGMRCHICRKKVKIDDLHFDHVIPLSKDGEHSASNIAVSHKSCNQSKSAKILTLF